MKNYDPQVDPNPDEWLALDEDARISLVKAWHRKAKIKLPNAMIHATFHVMVENTLAQREPRVQEALKRLQSQGLDRHDSIHAIASVIAAHVHEILTGGQPGDDTNAEYYRKIEKLTADSWLNSETD